MRQIKFRVWDGEQIHYSYMVAGAEYCDVLTILQDEEFAKKYYKVKEWTVMQFTGLLDCEGKEVWEGQIVDNDYLVVFLLGKFQLKSLSNNTYQDIYDNQHKVTGEYYKMEEN